MLGRAVLLVALLAVWGVNSSGPDHLSGKWFGGFFTSKMIDTLANASGLPFPLHEVPSEMKATVDQVASDLFACWQAQEEKLKASGNVSERDIRHRALVACTIQEKYDDLTLFFNLYQALHFLMNNSTKPAVQCHHEMMDNRPPKELFYLLDAKRLCKTLQFLDVPYCTISEMCGSVTGFDVSYGLFYAFFQFKANGFFQSAGSGDCPVASSDMGRSLNPKLFTAGFDIEKDAVFTRDVCEQYRQPNTSAVGKDAQDFINAMYASDF
ncbi:hypothetical protein M3Y99_00721400 [Aphelenchoides fujianensis]|nr:hypothetical protein M3Y99_00721400 [Aphelenchoides fujianensis]